MADLKTIQALFAQALIDGGEPDTALLDALIGGEIGAAGRIRIHQNNFRETLSDALIAQFPVLTAFVGEEFLKATAAAYVARHPPQDAALFALGQGFSAFLRDFEPARQVPYLADLARLEWAVTDVQNRAMPDLLPVEAVPDAWCSGHATLGQHVELVESRFPILQLWMVGTGQLTPAAVHVEGGGEACLVMQVDGGVQVVPLTAEQLACLKEKEHGSIDRAAMAAMQDWPVFVEATYH